MTEFSVKFVSLIPTLLPGGEGLFSFLSVRDEILVVFFAVKYEALH